jgi:alpha-glucosidase
MPWTGEPGAGFCPPGVEPWLPIGPDVEYLNVARQYDDPRSMLTLTRRLLAQRRRLAALRVGRYLPVEEAGVPDDCYVFAREVEGERVLVALNFAAEDRVVYLPDLPSGVVLLSTDLDREGPLATTPLCLRGGEGWLLSVSLQ